MLHDLTALKKSARPVSIGRVGGTLKGAGLPRSIRADATVWMVRFPPGMVSKRRVELK